MNTNRREILRILGSLGIVTPFAHIISLTKWHKPLKILVIGGTNFLGPAIVNAAEKKGHSLTLFNRQVTNPQLFPTIRKVRGNRESGAMCYKSLLNEKWDDVIDVWPEKSRLVDEASLALQKHTSHYVFISSIAVYRDFQEVGLHEESEVVRPGPNPKEWYYPEEKWVSEKFVRNRFENSHTILRPGPIKGWRDPAVDLLYWLVRLKNNQDILAPGSGNYTIQYIDVNDGGAFAVYAIENKRDGTLNCTGPMTKTLSCNYFLIKAKNYLSLQSNL